MRNLIVIVVSFQTNKNQGEILDKAVAYFRDTIGLKLTERGSCCAYFEDENQLGYITVTLIETGKKFEVKVESREYEYDAKKFMEEFK